MNTRIRPDVRSRNRAGWRKGRGFSYNEYVMAVNRLADESSELAERLDRIGAAGAIPMDYRRGTKFHQRNIDALVALARAGNADMLSKSRA